MITVTDIKEILEEITQADGYKRPMSNHPLEIYIGWNREELETLLLVCDKKPKTLLSSSTVDVRIGQRKDNKWAITFSLLNSTYFDIFCEFCCDLVNSSITFENADEGNEFVCQRYIKWQEMFKKKRGNVLDDNVIKGLIGELYFMKTYLFDKFGIENTILAWIGPHMTDQDYVFEKTWFEVKATTSGSEKVIISSIEQLDTAVNGHLAVIFLDKTSTINKNKITLNSIIYDIREIIGDELLLKRFNDALIDIGYYYSEEYDDICYQCSDYIIYYVNEDFPCIRRTNIPTSIKNAHYELLLSEIKEFKMEE